MITEKIETIRRLRHQKLLLNRQESELSRPLKRDLSEIPIIYQRFTEVCDKQCKDNKSLFIAIVVFLYSPVSFANNHISGRGIRRSIADVLKLSNSSVSVYFSNAKSLILNHRWFRTEVERLYAKITD